MRKLLAWPVFLLASVERSASMPSPVNRRSVDLSAFPDLVVIYLGMRVRRLAGIKTLLGLGPQIDKAGAGRPEGLLHFENNIIYSLFPLHIGMRWYWKDFASMERWTRSEPHRIWWQNFLRSSGGTRSEEHTSELQSQSNLVCRLLLEKKKLACALAHSRAREGVGRVPLT